jgi:hypothetical protein
MKFTKDLLKPGVYLAQGLDGTRKPRTITAEHLRMTAKTFNEMLAAGLQVPGPWAHNLPNPLGPVIGDKSKEIPANENAGFWGRVWFDDKDNTLYGELEAPRDEDSDRIGKTVREVSPLIKTFVDGSGKKWDNALYHIALVTHPVMANQGNFQPLEVAANLDAGDGYALALSDLQELLLTDKPPIAETVEKQEGVAMAQVGEPVKLDKSAAPANASNAGVAEAIKALVKLKIALPDDTTPENFIERLVIAINAIEKANEPDKPDKPDNKPAIEQPMPIAMTLGDPTVAEPITPAVNPLQVFAEGQARKSYIDRIEALVKTGRTTPAYALKHLKTLVEGFALSLGDDGEPKKGLLDELLEALEAIPENTVLNVSGSAKTGKDKKGIAFSFEEPLPEGYEGEPGKVDDAEAIKAADEQVKKMEGRTETVAA